MWRVEVSATVVESQPYDVFDRFVSRAIGEAQLTQVASLAAFFGVDRSIVERTVRLLTTIGHAHRDGDAVSLTDLGLRSLRDGCRYVVKKDRRQLYFDGFWSQPMPGRYYSAVTWLDEPALELADHTRFFPLAAIDGFRVQAVNELLQRPDRGQYHVPEALSDATVRTVDQAWLPMYLLENGDSSPYVAFSNVNEEPDEHLSALCNTVPALADAVAAESPSAPG